MGPAPMVSLRLRLGNFSNNQLVARLACRSQKMTGLSGAHLLSSSNAGMCGHPTSGTRTVIRH